jgi:hypothetical protein
VLNLEPFALCDAASVLVRIVEFGERVALFERVEAHAEIIWMTTKIMALSMQTVMVPSAASSGQSGVFGVRRSGAQRNFGVWRMLMRTPPSH